MPIKKGVFAVLILGFLLLVVQTASPQGFQQPITDNPLDCNPNDPLIFYGQVEDCTDRIDNNCNNAQGGFDLDPSTGVDEGDPACCSINTINWKDTSLIEITRAGNRQRVFLSVEGSQACRGKIVQWDILEKDTPITPDDDYTPDPLPAPFNSEGQARSSWIADWQDESIFPFITDNPEYYFNAHILDNGTEVILRKSPLLEVTEEGPTTECGNGRINTGEDCNNCPDDAGCGNGEVCLQNQGSWVCTSFPVATCSPGDACAVGCNPIDPDCGGGTCLPGDGCGGGICNPQDPDCGQTTCQVGNGCLAGCLPSDPDCVGRVCDNGEDGFCVIGCNPIDPDCGGAATCAPGDGCGPQSCLTPDPDCDALTCQGGDGCLAGCTPPDPDCSGNSFCGNSVPDTGEDCRNCPQDMPGQTCLSCGNNQPDYLNGENCGTCPQDMPPGVCQSCGNGIIDEGEICQTCPQDLIATGQTCGTCGDNQLQQGENCYTCLQDATARGGTCYQCNGINSCEPGENCLCPDCNQQQDSCLQGNACTSYACGCNPLPDGICTADARCNSVDPDCCSITAASWQPTCSADRKEVNITVQTRPDCNGKELQFEVIEDDLVGDTLTPPPPTPTRIDNRSARTIWAANWTDDGFLQGDPEYYFNVKVGERKVKSANKLEVRPCGTDDFDCDGVTNLQDLCTSTPLCTGVNNEGCSKGQTRCLAEWDCTATEWSECDPETNIRTRDISKCVYRGTNELCRFEFTPAEQAECIRERAFPVFTTANLLITSILISILYALGIYKEKSRSRKNIDR